MAPFRARVLTLFPEMVTAYAGQSILGNAAANVLDGQGGADILMGFAGNDTFVFHDGDGADTVSDFALRSNTAPPFESSSVL